MKQEIGICIPRPPDCLPEIPESLWPLPVAPPRDGRDMFFLAFGGIAMAQLA